MDVLDLSHTLGENTPAYPGTEPLRVTEACTVASHGFAEKLLRIYSHTGTHVDVPAHMLEGAATLDALGTERFVGPGCLVDIAGIERARIEVADLEPHRERIARAEFALVRGGWAERWGDPSYFSGYPVLTEAAARWLTGFRLKGIGVDMISVDEMDSTTMEIHKIFFGEGMIIVENLAGLARLAGRDFIFSCLPLKIAGGDGSPVRAVALI